jgi:hypothetical protein
MEVRADFPFFQITETVSANSYHKACIGFTAFLSITCTVHVIDPFVSEKKQKNLEEHIN